MDVAQMLEGRFACPGCNASDGWTPIAQPAPRQNSIIYRLQCRQCDESIVAKLSRGDELRGNSARLQLRREHETLCELQRLFPADGRYGTLAPLGYVESAGRGIMITRLFGGVDLLRHMRTLDAAGVIETCRAAGIWLRKLHDSDNSSTRKRGLGVADKISYLAHSYGTVLHGSSGTRAAFLCLEQEGARIGMLDFRAVRQHGDFKPENMLCDGARYVGLDVQWQIDGPAVYDLAPFLNHLWLARRSLGPLANHQYPQAEAAFLAGYGYADDLRILRWAQLYFALCQLGGYRRRGRLVASYARWKIWPLARQLTGQLAPVNGSAGWA